MLKKRKKMKRKKKKAKTKVINFFIQKLKKNLGKKDFKKYYQYEVVNNAYSITKIQYITCNNNFLIMYQLALVNYFV